MQFFTDLSFSLKPAATDANPEQPQLTSIPADPGNHLLATFKPLWPDYFARRGQDDAITWQYKGYWRDTWRIWRTYYRFISQHPIVAFSGLHQFYGCLVYRIFGAAIGDRSSAAVAILLPLLLIFTPPLAALAVLFASVSALKKRVPPLFQPFNRRGWSNYCVMLALVFMLHGYRQRQLGFSPAHAAAHSRKKFWHDFFAAELPCGHLATRQDATCTSGVINGELPEDDLIIKPDAAGAGHQLHYFRWRASRGTYRCIEPKTTAWGPRELTRLELRSMIQHARSDLVIERAERARPPLPVCSLRILTLFTDDRAQLICAALLLAPDKSISTAYFDTDTYLLDYKKSRVGIPLAPNSKGRLTGTALPEMHTIIASCLAMHNKLREHVQISWDIIPAARGPVYLEANVFPPGCDYKLALFKNDTNFRWLCDQLLKPGQSLQGTPGIAR